MINVCSCKTVLLLLYHIFEKRNYAKNVEKEEMLPFYFKIH